MSGYEKRPSALTLHRHDPPCSSCKNLESSRLRRRSTALTIWVYKGLGFLEDLEIFRVTQLRARASCKGPCKASSIQPYRDPLLHKAERWNDILGRLPWSTLRWKIPATLIQRSTPRPHEPQSLVDGKRNRDVLRTPKQSPVRRDEVPSSTYQRPTGSPGPRSSGQGGLGFRRLLRARV